jgi:crotonobetainyl-CoA hydratase
LTIVSIERPDVYNALNADAHVELHSAFDDFANDESQWVAIITGAGERAFCAGHDLKQQAEGGGIRFPQSGFGGLTSRFDLTKPVIAAVNGVAMGGGFEIALACDIIVAAGHAKFALPEPKVGLAALAGGVHRLPQAIGLKRAMGMMLTGRVVTAQEGADLGFVNEVAQGDVLATARRWADEMLQCSPMSLRATKQAALSGLGLTDERALSGAWDYPAVKAMQASEDGIEGPAAFMAKRKPIWLGR